MSEENNNQFYQPRFIIRCPHCRWADINDGTSTSLKNFTEINNHCSNCGKPRQFRCPRCGKIAKMTRIKGE